MKTVYFNAAVHCRPHANVLTFPERRNRLVDGTALPLCTPESLEDYEVCQTSDVRAVSAALPEVTAEVVKEEPLCSLEMVIAWADAAASIVLVVGSLMLVWVLMSEVRPIMPMLVLWVLHVLDLVSWCWCCWWFLWFVR